MTTKYRRRWTRKPPIRSQMDPLNTLHHLPPAGKPADKCTPQELVARKAYHATLKKGNGGS